MKVATSEKFDRHLAKPEVQEGISTACMVCGNEDGPREFLWTGDENSCDGFEFWSYCDKCKIDTFHRIPLYNEIN